MRYPLHDSCAMHDNAATRIVSSRELVDATEHLIAKVGLERKRRRVGYNVFVVYPPVPKPDASRQECRMQL